jgi:hypothetical protein
LLIHDTARFLQPPQSPFSKGEIELFYIKNM